MDYCIDYVGLACVNGTCPKIENHNYSCYENVDTVFDTE